MNEIPPSTSPLRIVGSIIWAMGIVAMQGAIWLAWFIIMIKCVPPLEMVLAERDVQIPIMTQEIIWMARNTNSFWYLLVLLGLPLAIFEIVIVVVGDVSRSFSLQATRNVVVASFSLLPLLLMLYCIVALALTIGVMARDVAPL